MRRFAALLLPLGACAALAGCAAGSASAGPGTVTVSGGFGAAPAVSIPAAAPSAGLVVSTPVKGTGPALADGDSVLADAAVYKWSGTTHSLLQSTYGSAPQLIPPQSLPGLQVALKGARTGSRIVAVLPPKYAYGSAGYSPAGISGTDTLVYVMDVLALFGKTQSASGTQVASGGGALPAVTAVAGQAPVVKVPATAPPAKLSVTTLIQGTGPELGKGDTGVVQYTGYIWRTGQSFGSSWPSAAHPDGALLSFQDGGQAISGWNQGLEGVRAGSRVMLVIPPALGYGPLGGQASAGIKKDDTLVFVVDLLGVTPAR